MISRILYAVHPLLVKFRLRGLWKLPAAILRTLERDGYTPSVYGVWLRTNWSDATFVFGITGRWGFRLSDEIMDQAQANFVFVDIGSNFGVYSLLAAQAATCDAVYAIEPNPMVCRQLLENKVYNNAKKINLLECAISSSNGEMDLFISSSHTGTASLLQNRSGRTTVTVSIRDKDLLNNIAVKQFQDRFFVKIDVEGAEPQVIEQLEKSNMAPRVNKLFVEISPKWISKKEIDFIFRAIARMGLTEVWRSKGTLQYDVLFCRIPRPDFDVT